MSGVRGTREKKTNWAVVTAGLGGFVLGALTVLFILWAYSGFRTEDGLPAASPEQAAVPPAEAPRVDYRPGPPPTGSTAARPWIRPSPIEGAPATSGAGLGALQAGPDLTQRGLLMPVQGIQPEQLRDSFSETRGGGGRLHEALDIMAPRNTPVLAVEGGRVAKLFTSKQGGLTLYQFDPGETYAYYYAHLESYAGGIQEGVNVRRGQVIAYVGSSGNAKPDNPHLHFAIFLLTPEKRWWEGQPVNPFPVLGGASREEPSR